MTQSLIIFGWANGCFTMFDRQIDLIMKDFAPVAQRYLKHVARVNGLEDDLCWLKWTDSATNLVVLMMPMNLVMKSVTPFGTRILSGSCFRYQNAGWTFAANSGKDSGGWHSWSIPCASLCYELDRPFNVSIPWFMNRAFWSNLSFLTIIRVTLTPTCRLYVEITVNLQWVAVSDYLEHNLMTHVEAALP